MPRRKKAEAPEEPANVVEEEEAPPSPPEPVTTVDVTGEMLMGPTVNMTASEPVVTFVEPAPESEPEPASEHVPEAAPVAEAPVICRGGWRITEKGWAPE